MTRFLVWWLVTVIQLLAIGAAINFGAIEFLLDADKTYLSFGTFGIWLFASGLVGYTSWAGKTNHDTAWQLSTISMSVGMIGTLIGFILMLSGSNLANVDPSDIEGMKAIIGSMATGMSTALVTTLTGIIVSVFIQVQVLTQEHE